MLGAAAPPEKLALVFSYKTFIKINFNNFFTLFFTLAKQILSGCSLTVVRVQYNCRMLQLPRPKY
jgi:hypothetical protein